MKSGSLDPQPTEGIIMNTSNALDRRARELRRAEMHRLVETLVAQIRAWWNTTRAKVSL
jgi:hypothetical protein